MNDIATHGELIARRTKLNGIAAVLKERFLGLDSIVDEVMGLMMPWLLFPEAQRRPTVINMWGLTGSGKTALIQSIVELLEYRKLYTHIDMGEFESSSASWMKNIFTEDLLYFHEKPSIICLDEFQFARTLDQQNRELGKDKLRVVWDMLDSGRIEYIPDQSTYYLFRADSCRKRLLEAQAAGVVVQNGEVVSELEAFVRIFEGFYFDEYAAAKLPVTKMYFQSTDFIEGICGLFGQEELTVKHFREAIAKASLDEIKTMIEKGLRARPATKQLDISRSLIFVLGNLDEAYSMSKNINPDISADEFYEATSRITIAHIKGALKKRFRAEQIARLGNNHIIYRSFNTKHFRALIERELKGIGTFVQQRFGWSVTFDESVTDIVYAEGVFPAQGTRPVFTTIKNLIESRVSKLVVLVLEESLPVATIAWRYADGCFEYVLKDHDGQVLKTVWDEATLKLESLRKSIEPELQAHTAVHEAGHAVLAALTFRIVPSVVVSRTASDSIEGFCVVNFPKGPMTRESLTKDIVTTLGGYVAEKLVFGEDLTSSGVRCDIEEASALANKAVRQFAMGSDPIHLAVAGGEDEHAFFHHEAYKHEAVSLVKACERDAEILLRRNRLLLLKMAEYLTSHARMEENQIADYVYRYGEEPWIRTEGFVKKECYYSFNTVLRKQLHELESADHICLGELLVRDHPSAVTIGE